VTQIHLAALEADPAAVRDGNRPVVKGTGATVGQWPCLAFWHRALIAPPAGERP